MFEKEARTTFRKKATKIAEKKVKEFYKECGWEDYKYMISEFADVGTECMQKGAEFGYNKANEWHYVKDRDLPKDKTEKKYLVALKSEYGGFFYEIDIWCNSLHCFASNNPLEVYAWKEIVLPKLPKEM